MADLRIGFEVDIPSLKRGMQTALREASTDLESFVDKYGRLHLAVDFDQAELNQLRALLARAGEDGGEEYEKGVKRGRKKVKPDPPPADPPPKDPPPAQDPAKLAAAKVAAQNAELAKIDAIRAQFSSKDKARDDELTRELIANLKTLQQAKIANVAAIENATDASLKRQLQADQRVIQQQIRNLSTVAREKEGVLKRGEGASAGIAGIGRDLINPETILNPLKAGIAGLGLGLVFKEAIGIGSEFDKGVKELQAITGVAGDNLDNLALKARSLATEFGGSASGNITAFKGILSKLGPDIASSPAALEQMTRAVNTLSAATGDDAAASMDALTTGLLQFQVPLDDANAAAAEMTKQMNVMAAGAQFGAAEVPQVADAIKVAGVAASGAKVSFEETNAAIQALAAGGKVGAEAGTALRNVLGKLGEGRFLPKDVQSELKNAGVDINRLSDQSLSFTDRMRELQKISKDAALMTKLFGTENSAAANILLRSVDSIDELTEKVSGTQTAFEQAAINQSSFAAQVERGKAVLADFAIGAFNAVGPLLGQGLGLALNAVQGLVSVFGAMFGFIKQNQAVFIGLVAAVAGYVIAANIATVSTAAFSVAQIASVAGTKLVTAAQWLWNAAMSANPIGLLIAGVVGLVAVLATLGNSYQDQLEDEKAATEAQLEGIEAKKKANLAEQSRQKTIAQLASEYEKLATKANRSAAEEKKLGDISVKLNESYPGLISSTKSYAQNLDAVRKVGEGTATALANLSKEMAGLERQQRAASRDLALTDIQLTRRSFSATLSGVSFVDKDGKEIDPDLFISQKFEPINKALQDFVKSGDEQKFNAAFSGFRADLTNILGGLDPKDIKDARAALGDYIKSIEAYQAVLAGQFKKPEPAPTDTGGGTPTTTTTPDKKDPLTFAKELADAEQRGAELLGEVQLKNAKDERERIATAARLKRESLERKRQEDQADLDRQVKEAEAEGRAVDEANLRALRSQLNENARRETDLATQTEIEQQRALTQKLLDEELKASSATLQVAKDTAQAELDVEIANQEALNVTTAAGLQRRLDLQRQVQGADRQLLIANLVSQNEDYKRQFDDLQQQFASGTIKTEGELRTQLALLRSRFTAQIEDDPRVQAFDTRQATDNAAAERAITLQGKRETIAQERDLRRQAFLFDLLDLEEKLNEELKLAGSNGAKIQELHEQFARDRRQIEEDFLRDSDELFRASLDIRQGLIEGFNADIGDNDSRKAELEKLKREEQDLQESLDRRRISLVDFQRKSAELAERRRQVEGTNLSFTERLELAIQKAGVASAKKYADGRQQVAELAQQNYISVLQDSKSDEDTINFARTRALQATGVAMLASLAQVAAEGGNILKGFGAISVQVAADTLIKLIPIFIAELWGKAFAENPLTGGLIAAAATATILGLRNWALGGIQGNATGEVDIQGPGTTTSDSILRRVSRRESHLTAAATMAPGNADAFRWANRTGKSLQEYYRMSVSQDTARTLQQMLARQHVQFEQQMQRQQAMLLNEMYSIPLAPAVQLAIQQQQQMAADMLSMQSEWREQRAQRTGGQGQVPGSDRQFRKLNESLAKGQSKPLIVEGVFRRGAIRLQNKHDARRRGRRI